MRTISLTQGSPEWHAHRANHFNASDAPAMMGVSKYTSRAELLRLRSGGEAAEIGSFQQALFDRGHAAEAAIRPHIEKLIGEELYPATGVSDEHPKLSASFDGVTMDESVVFEHKLYNAELVARINSGEELEPHYYWQLEQQLLISGAGHAIFVCSDGTPENMAYCTYTPVAGRREQLIAGWKQFHKDLAAYAHEAPAVEVVAEAIMSLPSVSVQIGGSLTVTSNLTMFGEKLRQFVDGIDKDPQDDQAFANCESAIKVLKTAEDALDAAEASALAQVAAVDELVRAKAMYVKLARDTRLMLEKLVKSQKDVVRAGIQQKAQQAFADHIAEINKRLGKPYMPAVAMNAAEAMKGKKTITSLKDAAGGALATAKIEADRIAKIIDANLATLREKAGDHKFLFNDTAQLVLKDPEAVAAIVSQRITEHEAEQKRKAEAAAEEARAKIRKEEQEKAEADARKKLADEQAAQQQPAPVAQAEPARNQDTASSRYGEGASTPEQAAVSAPAAQATTATPTPITTKPAAQNRPTDDQMIEVLALHFRAHESKVIEWLLAMDLDAASNRLAKAI